MKRPNKIINYCLNHKSFYLMATKDPIAFCGATGAQYPPPCTTTRTRANSFAVSRTQIGK